MNVIVTNANRPKPPRKPKLPKGGNEGGIPGEEAAIVDDAAAPPPTPDDTSDRVIKLVPAEVIAGYTALLSITASVVDDSTVKYAIPLALVACSILLVLVLRRAGKQHNPSLEVPLLQHVFSILAFWAWALAIRDPLEPFGYYVPRWLPAFGCLLIPLFGAYAIDATDDDPKKEP